MHSYQHSHGLDDVGGSAWRVLGEGLVQVPGQREDSGIQQLRQIAGLHPRPEPLGQVFD